MLAIRVKAKDWHVVTSFIPLFWVEIWCVWLGSWMVRNSWYVFLRFSTVFKTDDLGLFAPNLSGIKKWTLREAGNFFPLGFFCCVLGLFDQEEQTRWQAWKFFQGRTRKKVWERRGARLAISQIEELKTGERTCLSFRTVFPKYGEGKSTRFVKEHDV